jgi:hypothetical protein
VAKKRSPKGRRTPAIKTRVVTPPPAPMIDMGKKVAVTVKKAPAGELEYTLSDGTKLVIRPVILSVDRSLEAFNPDGDPIYQVATGLVMKTIVPKGLKRKTP